MYKGQVVVEEAAAQQIDPLDYERKFRDRMVDSINKQGNDAT